MFFSLKLHKLTNLNLFICFNNILKKISFSSYIKCNTRHFNEKIYISLRKGIFQCFSFHFHVWVKMRKKARNILTFHGNSFFFSQNFINYPVSAFLGELTSFLRKTTFILVQKIGIYAISRKKFLFTEKVNFWMIFCLFHCFHQTINKKHWILPQYTFFWKI